MSYKKLIAASLTVLHGEIYKKVTKKMPIESVKMHSKSEIDRKYTGRENYNERELYKGNLNHRYMISKYSFMTHACS